jgi:hypothetical protein
VLVTDGLAERLHGKVKLDAANVHVLAVKGDPKSLLLLTSSATRPAACRSASRRKNWGRRRLGSCKRRQVCAAEQFPCTMLRGLQPQLRHRTVRAGNRLSA